MDKNNLNLKLEAALDKLVGAFHPTTGLTDTTGNIDVNGTIESQEGAGLVDLAVAIDNVINIFESKNGLDDSEIVSDWTGDYPAIFLSYEQHQTGNNYTSQLGVNRTFDKAKTLLSFAGNLSAQGRGAWQPYGHTKRRIVNLGGEMDAHNELITKGSNSSNIYSYGGGKAYIIPLRNTTGSDITYNSSNAFRIDCTSDANSEYNRSYMAQIIPDYDNNNRSSVSLAGLQYRMNVSMEGKYSEGHNTASTNRRTIQGETGSAFPTSQSVLIPANTTVLLIIDFNNRYNGSYGSSYYWQSACILENLDAIIDGTNIVVDKKMLGTIMSGQWSTFNEIWTKTEL